MVAFTVQVQNGWEVGSGWTLGTSNPTGNGFITYTEMDPPVIPGNQLEDG